MARVSTTPHLLTVLKKSMWVHKSAMLSLKMEPGVFQCFQTLHLSLCQDSCEIIFFLSFKPVNTLRKQPFNLLGNCSSSLFCFSEVTDWAELGFSLTTTKGKKSFLKMSLQHFFAALTLWCLSLMVLPVNFKGVPQYRKKVSQNVCSYLGSLWICVRKNRGTF